MYMNSTRKLLHLKWNKILVRKKVGQLALLCTLLLICWGSDVVAQNRKQEVFKQGELYAGREQYARAHEFLQEAHDLDPTNERYVLTYAKNLVMLKDADEAKEVLLRYMAKEPKFNEICYYWLGRTFHLQQDFAAAIDAYKSFLIDDRSDDSIRKEVVDRIRRAKTGMDLTGRSQAVFIENLGEEINGPYDESYPQLSPNRTDLLYYSSADEKVVDQQVVLDADMYRAVYQNGQWMTGGVINEEFNSTSNEYLEGFLNGGQVMVFFRGQANRVGTLLVDTFSAVKSRVIGYSQFDFPTFANKGDGTLYMHSDALVIFSSLRPGGFGGYDLYYSYYLNGQWSMPQNFGPQVNSTYDEVSPFLSADGQKLYFASNGPESMGGYDIFETTYTVSAWSWTKRKNMGMPINTAGDEMSLRIAKDGNTAIFSSDRPLGYGGSDLYIAYFQQSLVDAQINSAAGLPTFVVHKLKMMGEDVPVVEVATTEENKETQTEEIVEQELLIPLVLDTIEMNPLYYVNANDVWNIQNEKTLDQLVVLLRSCASCKVQFSSFSHDYDGPNYFDVYFALKRTDKIVEYLEAQGINSNQIITSGIGSQYPLVNKQAFKDLPLVREKLNKRIEFKVYGSKPFGFVIQLASNGLSQDQLTKAFTDYENMNKGLSYRIYLLSSNQVLKNDWVEEQENLYVERIASEDKYDYFVGWWRSGKDARNFLRQLNKSAFPISRVAAFYNGIQLSDAEIEKYAEQYPELKKLLNN